MDDLTDHHFVFKHLMLIIYQSHFAFALCYNKNYSIRLRL